MQITGKKIIFIFYKKLMHKIMFAHIASNTYILLNNLTIQWKSGTAIQNFYNVNSVPDSE